MTTVAASPKPRPNSKPNYSSPATLESDPKSEGMFQNNLCSNTKKLKENAAINTTFSQSTFKACQVLHAFEVRISLRFGPTTFATRIPIATYFSQCGSAWWKSTKCCNTIFWVPKTTTATQWRRDFNKLQLLEKWSNAGEFFISQNNMVTYLTLVGH